MLNTVWIVGRIENDPQINDEKHLSIKVTVPKPFKNEEGYYENDVLPVEVFFDNYERVMKYMNKGDLIGIKGMLAVLDNRLIINCEKLTFISKADVKNDK